MPTRPVNLRAFGRDLAGYYRSPWPGSQRLKAAGLLLLHRFNRWSGLRFKANQTLTIQERRRPLTLAMRMDTDDFFAFQEIFVDRYYDDAPGEPATILDLGANCGYATLLFACRYPNARLAAVEPHPANVSALRRNLALNGVEAMVVAGAVTREDGPATLHVSTSLGHSLAAEGPLDPTKGVVVDGWSVPTLMRRLGWDRIDLLKIDIEGYESVLFADRPAWLGRVSRIIGEVHDGYGFAALRSDLAPLGFRVTALAHPSMFLAVRP